MDGLPPNAQMYLPVMVEEVRAFWPSHPIPETLAAQVEQETCPSLKSKRCWSPKAELKTNREYGFGLGQITKTDKFDNFAAAKALHASLTNWQWSDRFDARKQLRTMVLMDKALYTRVTGAASEYDRLSMTFAAYNGGAGGLAQDRRICAATRGCNPSKWFGHVELYSRKSRAKAGGYGQSFFEINRGYVRNIMVVRPIKYRPYVGSLK